MFRVVWDYSANPELFKGPNNLNKTFTLKGYKTEIKIFAYSGLAYSGFEQLGPDQWNMNKREKWSEVKTKLHTNKKTRNRQDYSPRCVT